MGSAAFAGRLPWRLLVPAVATGAGLLLATSATAASGTDLRTSRSVALSQLVAQREREVARLAATARTLSAAVALQTRDFAAAPTATAAERGRQRELAAAAGLTPVSGPALTVVLDDAPRPPAGTVLPGNPDPADLVVHEQDIQGVVNALRAGGAEAITIMGRRIVATTAVRCVGNTLLLQGRVYSPPFRITAVGDPTRLQAGLDRSTAVGIYRQYVAAYRLGYTVSVQRRATLPAYDGTLLLRSARAAA